MNYNYLTKNCVWNEEKLVEFGFEKQDNVFCFRQDMFNGLFVEVKVATDIFEVDVTDGIFNERYQPFYSGHGGSAIKSQVRGILEEIISRCSTQANARTQIISYMQQRYGTICEHPWDDSPNFCTFKTEKNKWYAIIMDVTEKQLGFPSDAPVDIINVKLDPQNVARLVDGVRYFPAYHMNKKYWLTARLDKNTDLKQLQALIDESYNLVK